MNKKDTKNMLYDALDTYRTIVAKRSAYRLQTKEKIEHAKQNTKNDMIKKYYKDQKILRHIERGEWQFLPDIIKIDGKVIINPRKSK